MTRRHGSKQRGARRHIRSRGLAGGPGLGGWLLVLGMAALLVASGEAADSFTSVYLSECLADQAHGIKDDDGELTGWIEIHNGGSVTVNLAGWFLTDSPANLTRWRFPSVAVLPDRYLVVFASGKGRTGDPAHLHTDFRLEARGGFLALVNRGTNVISELSPSYAGNSAAGVSFGRVRGEPALRGRFTHPTPGRPNAIRGAEFAPEVVFSRAGGTFIDPLTVQLSCSATGAILRYTLDGSLPTSRSEIYRTPLSITNTTQLRTRAYQAGLFPGPPGSAAYVKLAGDVTAFSSSLPVLVMDTLGQERTAAPQGSFVHLSWHEPVNGRTSLTNPPAVTTRAAFRVRGSTSSGMPQQGFAMHFLDEFNQEKPLAVLGLPADSDWILYAPNVYDPVLIHNPFVHQLSRDMGRYSPRTRFLEVFVVDGPGPVRQTHYNGVYVLEERIKIGPNRVNIDRLGPDDLQPPQVTGGYVVKVDRLGPGEGGLAAGGAELVYVEPKEQLINLPQRAPQRKYLGSFFDDFDRALHGADWLDPIRGYRGYLDVDAAIDFHVLEVLSGNVDALVLSTYLHKPRRGKIVFGPHWDFDRALGSTDGRDENPRIWNTGHFFGGPWWPRLFRDTDFWQRWVDRWQELRQTYFATANLHGLIDRLAGELREAQPREYARWNFQPRGGSYQSELDLMKSWLASRVEFIDSQLVAPPRLSQPGGELAPGSGSTLALSARTNASVYYTLDGSDPRLSQGALSTNAVLYTGPIALRGPAQVTARARDTSQRQTGGPPSSTPWSGAVRAVFTVPARPAASREP